MRIAILVSGSGSNLQAILDARAADPAFPAEPVVVVSDNPDAYGLERAEAAKIPTAVVAWSDYADRAAFTAAICSAARRHGAEALVLAGFMRVLSPGAIAEFPILNVHPSMLPAFPGAHAPEEALEYGVKMTGVTVHFVDEKVDHGPIIAQEPVPVEPEDTPEALHARIQAVEHRLYPLVVRAFAEGRLVTEGRHVIWKEPEA